MYDLALFVHLLGVVLLVAAVTTTLVATLRAQRAATVAEVASLTAVTKKIDLVIGPATLLILASALYMVARGGDDGGIHWTSGWVDVALVVFLLMSVLGPTVEAGHAKRLLRMAAELPDGPVPPELDAARRSPAGVYVTFFGVSQILAFLYLMTNKPGLLGSITACAVAGVLSACLAAARLRALVTTPPGECRSGRAFSTRPRLTREFTERITVSAQHAPVYSPSVLPPLTRTATQLEP